MRTAFFTLLSAITLLLAGCSSTPANAELSAQQVSQQVGNQLTLGQSTYVYLAECENGVEAVMQSSTKCLLTRQDNQTGERLELTVRVYVSKIVDDSVSLTVSFSPLDT